MTIDQAQVAGQAPAEVVATEPEKAGRSFRKAVKGFLTRLLSVICLSIMVVAGAAWGYVIFMDGYVEVTAGTSEYNVVVLRSQIPATLDPDFIDYPSDPPPLVIVRVRTPILMPVRICTVDLEGQVDDVLVPQSEEWTWHGSHYTEISVRPPWEMCSDYYDTD